MNVRYIGHAKQRMKQRAITELEVEHVLEHPTAIIKKFDGRQEAVGEANNREIHVIFVAEENYIKVITVM